MRVFLLLYLLFVVVGFVNVGCLEIGSSPFRFSVWAGVYFEYLSMLKNQTAGRGPSITDTRTVPN